MPDGRPVIPTRPNSYRILFYLIAKPESVQLALLLTATLGEAYQFVSLGPS